MLPFLMRHCPLRFCFSLGFNRPKALLVFINPISGKRKAVKIFREKIAPLFQLAKITAHVMQTERRYHARDILQTYNLHDVDGYFALSFNKVNVKVNRKGKVTSKVK